MREYVTKVFQSIETKKFLVYNEITQTTSQTYDIENAYKANWAPVNLVRKYKLIPIDVIVTTDVTVIPKEKKIKENKMSERRSKKLRKICISQGVYPDQTEYHRDNRHGKNINTVMLSPNCGRFFYQELKTRTKAKA